MNKMDQAVACFREGFSCSQAIVSTFAADFSLDRDTALKIACSFGGGMAQMADTCGAVTGAFMVIGLKHGRTRLDDLNAKQETYRLVKEFVAQFKARHKTIVCRELLGYDMSIEQEKKLIDEQQLTKTICPQLVREAAEILEQIL